MAAEASKVSLGNWNVKATCPNGHTSYRNQMQLDHPNDCPECGLRVS